MAEKSYEKLNFTLVQNLKKNIDELKESENKYRTLFESSSDAIMMLAPPDWKFTAGNPATLKMFRAKDEKEFVSKGPWEVSPKFQPDRMLSGAKAKKMIEIAMEKGSNFFEWTHQRISGEDFPATVLLTRTEIAGKPLLQATVRDITEIKKAEKELLESKNMLENLTNGIEESILLLSKDFKIIWANMTAVKQSGYKREEIIGNHCYNITHHRSSPCKGPHDPCLLKEALKTGKPAKATHIHFRKDGEKFFAEISVYPIKDEKRHVVNLVHITRDITEKKKAEEALKESEEKFRAIFEGASDGILVADARTKKLVLVNLQACVLTGYSEKELLRLGIPDIHPKASLSHVLSEVDKQLRREVTVAKDLPVLRKDKRVVFCDINAVPIRIGERDVLLGFFRDVTERKKLEEKLRQKLVELEDLNKRRENTKTIKK